MSSRTGSRGFVKPLNVVHEGHVATDVFTSGREVIRSERALALKVGELFVDAPFDLLGGKRSQISIRASGHRLVSQRNGGAKITTGRL